MRNYRAVLLIVIAVAWTNVLATAQTPSAGAAPHVAAAKKAAAQDQLVLFNALCVPPPPIRPLDRVVRPLRRRARRPDRSGTRNPSKCSTTSTFSARPNTPPGR